MQQWNWSCEGASPHRLVVHARRLAGTLRREPCVGIIVSKGKLAGNTIKLGGESPVRAAEVAVVGEKNGVQALPRERRTLVFPGCCGRLYGIIKGHTECMVSGFNEGFTRVPVNAD